VTTDGSHGTFRAYKTPERLQATIKDKSASAKAHTLRRRLTRPSREDRRQSES
jgi:hypothetical protein